MNSTVADAQASRQRDSGCRLRVPRQTANSCSLFATKESRPRLEVCPPNYSNSAGLRFFVAEFSTRRRLPQERAAAGSTACCSALRCPLATALPLSSSVGAPLSEMQLCWGTEYLQLSAGVGMLLGCRWHLRVDTLKLGPEDSRQLSRRWQRMAASEPLAGRPPFGRQVPFQAIS